MNRIEEAVAFAVRAHAGAVRKGTELPYILHPMEAAAIAAQLTSDPDVIAAAVLHDVLEDTPCGPDELRAAFGERVAALVLSNSEDKRRGSPAEETWEVRKQETLDHLRGASREEKIVAFADKLSNLRSILNDYYRLWEALWQRFRQKDPAKHLWYYEGVYDACAELDESPLYMEYGRILGELRSRIREYEEFGWHDPDSLEIVAAPGSGKWVFKTAHSGDVLVMTQEEFDGFVSGLRNAAGPGEDA